MNCPAQPTARIDIGRRTAALASSSPAQQFRPQGTVLVVDDSRTNRIILQRQLQSAGWQVQQAANGREALAQIGQCCFDFVLMDCQMPEMDGYEATRLLRQREGKQVRTIVIALTANTRPGHKEICLDAGMDGYLNKPISKADLLQLLQHLPVPPADRDCVARRSPI